MTVAKEDLYERVCPQCGGGKRSLLPSVGGKGRLRVVTCSFCGGEGHIWSKAQEPAKLAGKGALSK